MLVRMAFGFDVNLIILVPYLGGGIDLPKGNTAPLAAVATSHP
jgi:hypothetical protein